VRTDIETTITWLTRRIKDVDIDIDKRIRTLPVWREREALLSSVPASIIARSAKAWVLRPLGL
jgi:hypothetical protein